MKILYAVAGEGHGHAYRSVPIIEHLQKKSHTIDLYAGDVSFPILSKYGAKRISSLRIVYVCNEVSNILSTVRNVLWLPWHALSILRLAVAFAYFRPDVVVNDFEVFSNLLAKLFSVPVVTVDNESILTSTTYDVPKGQWFNAMKVRAVVRLISPFAYKRVIPTFFYPFCSDFRARLLPPVIRQEILALKPSVKSHILVYQTSQSNSRLIPALQSFPSQQFVVYGMGKKPLEKNVEFVDFDEGRFLQDLRDCNAVITNGGFTLMTEAIALRKPVLALAIAGQFEQVLNAVYLEKQGWGKCSFVTDTEVIRKFLKEKEKFRKRLQKLPRHSNKPFFQALDEALVEVVHP